MKLTETVRPNFEQLARLSRRRPVWLRVGRLFDGQSVLHDAHLVFGARQIEYVGVQSPSAGCLAEGQDLPDAVLPDAVALPCLIEAHAHLFLDGAPVKFEQRENYLKQDADWMLKRACARWPKIVECGIGAVRDAGDKYHVGLSLAAQAKTRLGQLSHSPWIDSPGAAIHHRGKYGSFMGMPMEEFASPADCVASRVAAGADRIKLLVTGIINFNVGQVTTPPQMTVDEVAALVNAARAHGRQTFAHASGTDGIENSIEGGVNTVEHGFFITARQLATMRDRQIGWVPTFAPVQLQIDRAGDLGWSDEVVGHLQRIIAGHQQMLCHADALGVRIVAGSDAGSCGVPHAIGFLDELCHMENAGISPLSVLRAATGTSASVLNFAEPIGRLAAGCRSRFIVTEHDPLASVANLRKEKVVVFDGEVIRGAGKMDANGL